MFTLGGVAISTDLADRDIQGRAYLCLVSLLEWFRWQAMRGDILVLIEQ